jgi:hypothetical protein
MQTTLFDKNGEAVAYMTTDFDETIYLWEGHPVAYRYENHHIYGFNGRHIGWFIDQILYDNDGKRIGFTSNTCPVDTSKEPVKTERYPKDKKRSRWSAPPLPNLSFRMADQTLREFLIGGQAPGIQKIEKPEEASE